MGIDWGNGEYRACPRGKVNTRLVEPANLSQAQITQPSYGLTMRRLLFSLFLALPVPALAQVLPSHTTMGDGYAVLIISRERLEVASPCEFGVYLQDQLAARLFQGQSVAFNLPPGDVSVRLGMIGTESCQAGITPLDSQRLVLQAGEIRRYRIGLSPSGPYLTPAPSSQ